MNPNAMAMHPEDAREVLDDSTLARIARRDKDVAAIVFALVELPDPVVAALRRTVEAMVKTARENGTARPLTSASLAAEQQAREQTPPVSSGT